MDTSTKNRMIVTGITSMLKLTEKRVLHNLGWDGMGWDGMGWVGMEWDVSYFG